MTHTDPRLEQVEALYEKAVFNGDATVLPEADRVLDAVEADLALARGRIIHARYLRERVDDPEELALFERAAALYRELGDARGEGEATFWIGTCHQVVHQDAATALPAHRRSLELAEKTGDRLTASYALRHLGFADHMDGRLAEAREKFEESVRLRRELGFLPGVAANLVGLVYIAVAEGRQEDAVALAEEGAALAESCGARAILEQIEEARAAIPDAD